MDMSQYRELFVSEARHYLEQMDSLILRLEQQPDELEAIGALFRAIHSLKGMASTMSYAALTTLAHRMEDLMEQVRSKTLAFNPALADLLLAGTAALAAMVNAIATDSSPEHDNSVLLTQFDAFGSQVAPATPASPTAPESAPAPALPLARLSDSSSVRIRTRNLDRLIDMSGELLTVRHRLALLADQLQLPELTTAVQQLSNQVRRLHGEVLTMRTIPVTTLTERFPRMLREIARRSDKEVEFLVTGTGMELDRSIIDQLAEPLLHLLRNAVDHGLETREERLASGKPPAGRIQLGFSREQDHVHIRVEDDGRGMNPQALVATAVAKGMLTAAEGKRLSTAEAFALICRPGFSTAPEVTDVSGRGVGMDVVQTMVSAMGGSLAIDASPGAGSRLQLRVPLSVAIVSALLVTAGPFIFAVPSHSISRTLDLPRDMVVIRERRPYVQVGAEQVPLFSLNRTFGVPLPATVPASLPLFVVEVRGQRRGMVVDRFLGQQEIFVKPLGKPLAALAGIAGCALLGDGTVAYVLDIPRLP